MDPQYILLAVSIISIVACIMSGNIGPGVVTVMSLGAVYMYKMKDQMASFFPKMSEAAVVATVKKTAESTGTKGVCKATVSRQSRNHRPGLPPPRDEKMLQVLPDSVVPSETSNSIRRRQVGLFF